MAIPFESPIIIKNEFNNGFLTFEKIGMADSSTTKGTSFSHSGTYINKKPIESNETYNIPVKTPSATSDAYEVVTHFVDLSIEKEVPMPWRFKLHVNNVENDILVQHDVVFLQHTEKYQLFHVVLESWPLQEGASFLRNSKKETIKIWRSTTVCGR
jgi:hypothetical protein